jgi:hypothetical protein
LPEKPLHLNPIDMARIFHPNQQVEIVLDLAYDNKDGSGHIAAKGRITSVKDDSLIVALEEKVDPRSTPFRVGRTVTIQTGRGDGVFCFTSKVINLGLEKEFILILEAPQITPCQERRGGARMPLNVSVSYQPLRYGDRDLGHLAAKLGHGESQDLSQGGITLRTNLRLPAGLILLVHMKLEGELIPLIGQVVRSHPADDTGQSFITGVKFLDPTPEQQELIVEAEARHEKEETGELSL